ncbi:MAG: autotransporter outer membrane beta-barrel domain-containing protein, partial [Halocynthiibacter sp.]
MVWYRYLGADYLTSPDLLVGALVQYDTMRDSSATLNYMTEGTGWMAGPYLTARLDDNLFLDARLAWGRSDNRYALATSSGNFETERWLVNISLTGDFQSGIWSVQPNLSLSYMEEQQGSFIDSLNVLIASQTVSRGQVRLGPNFSTRFTGDNGAVYEPFFTVDAIYSYENSNSA